MYYYGFMVTEIDGIIEKVEGEFDYKPSIEHKEFLTYYKWYKSETERNKRYIELVELLKNIT